MRCEVNGFEKKKEANDTYSACRASPTIIFKLIFSFDAILIMRNKTSKNENENNNAWITVINQKASLKRE